MSAREFFAEQSTSANDSWRVPLRVMSGQFPTLLNPSPQSYTRALGVILNPWNPALSGGLLRRK